MNTNNPLKVLIVDDDLEICALLAKFLREHQIEAHSANDSRQADKLLSQMRFDLIVLDLMMPGEDGLNYCRRLRAQSAIPIIMLTAMGDELDRIIGLEMGADDYLPKPFNPRELLARIRAVLRRYEQLAPGKDIRAQHCYQFEQWQLNPKRRELRNAENILISLTSGEYDLLTIFVEHPQQVLSRDQLLDLSKGRAGIPFDRSIDVQLSRLRQKIETDPKHPVFIKTIRNGGYMFCVDVEQITCG